MNLDNWLLSVAYPIPTCFENCHSEPNGVRKNIESMVSSAAQSSGVSAGTFYEWLAVTGCLLTNVIFYDGTDYSDSSKVHLLLVADDPDFAKMVKELKDGAPGMVSYFYTTLTWLSELSPERSTFQVTQWIPALLSSEHAMLSTDSNCNTRFGDVREAVRNRFLRDPEGHIAELVAADIYTKTTARLPEENSIQKMPTRFKTAVSDLRDPEIECMAIRTLEKRKVLPVHRGLVKQKLKSFLR